MKRDNLEEILSQWDDEKVWEEIEKGLDKSKKRRALPLWFGVGFLLMSISGFLIYVNNVDDGTNNESNFKPPQSITAAQLTEPVQNTVDYFHEQNIVPQAEREMDPTKILVPTQKVQNQINNQISNESDHNTHEVKRYTERALPTSIENTIQNNIGSKFSETYKDNSIPSPPLKTDLNINFISNLKKEIPSPQYFVPDLAIDTSLIFQIKKTKNGKVNSIVVSASTGFFDQNWEDAIMTPDLSKINNSIKGVLYQNYTLGYARKFSKNWGLSVGLQYRREIVNLNTEDRESTYSFIPSDSAYIVSGVNGISYYDGLLKVEDITTKSYDVYNRTDYLSLPIGVSYEIIENFSFVVGLNFNLYTRLRGYTVEDNKMVNLINSNVQKPAFLEINHWFGAIDYRFILNNGLNIITGIEYYHNIRGTKVNNMTHNDQSIGLRIGLDYNF